MAYSFYRTVTIDHTKCGAADSTNFPVTFFGTYTYLKTTGNGGDVTSSSGYDIVFCTDNTGATLYDFELVTYSATTGAVEFHIRIPTLSHTVDTVIYLFYGNASVTTYQGTTSTWNSDIRRVYHLADGSTLSGANSTATSATLTIGGAITAITGQIDGGANRPSTTPAGLSTATITGLPTGSSAFSLSCWMRTVSVTNAILWSFGADASESFHEVYIDLNGPGGGKLAVGDQAAFSAVTSTTTNNDGNWHHVVATYTGSGSHASVVYVDGVSRGTSSTTLTPATAPTNLAGFNLANDVGNNFPFVGDLDELRVYAVALTADWVLTEYNNQFDPTTFYAIGAAVPIGGGGGVSGAILGRVINLAVRVH